MTCIAPEGCTSGHGQAAATGYLLQDEVEKALVQAGVIPADEIALVIQDKALVPKPERLASHDPTWDTGKHSGRGSLRFAHVYMPNQNHHDSKGMNAVGRWHYGPWFRPRYTGLGIGPVPNTCYVPEAPSRLAFRARRTPPSSRKGS